MRHFPRELMRHLFQTKQEELNGKSLSNFVSIASGIFSPGKLTLFSIFRDEIYFCRAFFNHYRKIGIEQFLILDDGSSDGTESFLRGQGDCVTLSSTLSFGQTVRYRLPQQAVVFGGAEIALKTLIPHHFMLDSYGLYADADEFLILPPGVSSLGTVIERMGQSNARAVVGTLLEFFPRKLPTFQLTPRTPESFSQLVSENPYFETAPLIELDPDEGFRKTGRTKSEMLFERFGVTRRWSISGLSPRPTSPRFKTPILRHGPEAFRLGSHKVSVPASTDILLTMAHFIFTPNFVSKIERARARKGHASRSAKYAYYAQLAEKMSQPGVDLLGPQSRAFLSAQDLIECGHMKWV